MIPQDVYPLAKRAPIYLADPARPRRALPITIITGLASLSLAALGWAIGLDNGGAVLAALGCAGVFGLVFKPTRVPTTERVYTVFGVRLRGDEETDRLFDEGRW